jgi:hypothetical protein
MKGYIRLFTVNISNIVGRSDYKIGSEYQKTVDQGLFPFIETPFDDYHFIGEGYAEVEILGNVYYSCTEYRHYEDYRLFTDKIKIINLISRDQFIKLRDDYDQNTIIITETKDMILRRKINEKIESIYIERSNGDKESYKIVNHKIKFLETNVEYVETILCSEENIIPNTFKPAIIRTNGYMEWCKNGKYIKSIRGPPIDMNNYTLIRLANNKKRSRDKKRTCDNNPKNIEPGFKQYKKLKFIPYEKLKAIQNGADDLSDDNLSDDDLSDDSSDGPTPEILKFMDTSHKISYQWMQKLNKECKSNPMMQMNNLDPANKEMTRLMIYDPILNLLRIRDQTPENCLAAVKYSGYALHNIDPKMQTPEIVSIAVSDKGTVLEKVRPDLITYDLCLKAFTGKDPALTPQSGGKNDGEWLAIQYVPEKFKTREICLLACKSQNGFALPYIPDIYVEECFSVSKDAKLYLLNKKFRTPEICLLAVSRDGYELSEVPKNLITPEICLAAVNNNPHSILKVPSDLQTEELCLVAIKADPYTISLIYNQTENLCLTAVKLDGRTYRYIRKPTREMFDEANKEIAKNNPMFENTLYDKYTEWIYTDDKYKKIETDGKTLEWCGEGIRCSKYIRLV